MSIFIRKQYFWPSVSQSLTVNVVFGLDLLPNFKCANREESGESVKGAQTQPSFCWLLTK